MPDPVRGGERAWPVAIATLAVACCAAGPLLAALVGSLAVGALIGIGFGVVLLGAAFAVIYVRSRAGSSKPGMLK